MDFTINSSKEFFWSLRKASVELLSDLKIPIDPGYKTSAWQKGRPVGATLHFTAGVSWRGSASWLNDPKNRGSSCHMLMLDRKLGEADHIYSKYPILDDMPVTCILLADLHAATWHATWSNRLNFGIENRNAGKLRYKDGQYFWWANNWTAEFPSKVLEKSPIQIDGLWWEPYTTNQILGNIIVLRMLHQLYLPHGGLDPNWIIPHSAVQMEKFDTGRAFPLTEVRNAVFTTTPLDQVSLPGKVISCEAYLGDHDSDAVDMSYQGDRSDQQTASEDVGAFCFLPNSAYLDPGSHPDMLGTNVSTVTQSLVKLGYYASTGLNKDKELHTAIYQFQRCAGLDPDGVPGPKTRKAIMDRLSQFGYTPQNIA